jgi:predicted DNA-binding transcriptional regulator YafY
MLTKNALTRYFLINECLTHPRKRYWTLEEIMEKAEARNVPVTKRTLEYDLHAMRYDEGLNYRAPIVYCKKNKGFHYTDADYSIERLPLTEDDVETFDLMVQALQRFKGAQVLQQVEGMFDKLGKVADQLQLKKKKPASPAIVAFEHIPNVKGIDHFDVLHEAILKQRPLLIIYKRFDSDRATEHVAHPYLLKEYKFRWYLLCYSERRRHKVILALDRMECVSRMKVPFKPYTGKELLHYFEHTIGVTLGEGAAEEIVLWFSPLMAPYIKTQLLHHSQATQLEDANGLVIVLKLIPNPELIQLILGYGAEVKVIKPASLRNKVAAIMKKGVRLYEV